MGFDFPGRKRQDLRPLVAAAVFDHQYRMCDPSQFALGVSIVMGPRRPQRATIYLAVTLEPPHLLPSPSVQKVEELSGGIPAIKEDIRGLQSPPSRLPEQPDR